MGRANDTLVLGPAELHISTSLTRWIRWRQPYLEVVQVTPLRSQFSVLNYCSLYLRRALRNRRGEGGSRPTGFHMGCPGALLDRRSASSLECSANTEPERPSELESLDDRGVAEQSGIQRPGRVRQDASGIAWPAVAAAARPIGVTAKGARTTAHTRKRTCDHRGARFGLRGCVRRRGRADGRKPKAQSSQPERRAFSAPRTCGVRSVPIRLLR